MLYNKNQFRKTNDKKVLHKIGKHWVTVSVAFLSLLGLGAVSTTATTHADTTDNANAQTTSAAPNSNSADSIQKQVTKQANALHNQLLGHAAVSQKPAQQGTARLGSVNGRVNQAQTQNVQQNKKPASNNQMSANHSNIVSNGHIMRLGANNDQAGTNPMQSISSLVSAHLIHPVTTGKKAGLSYTVYSDTTPKMEKVTYSDNSGHSDSDDQQQYWTPVNLNTWKTYNSFNRSPSDNSGLSSFMKKGLKHPNYARSKKIYGNLKANVTHKNVLMPFKNYRIEFTKGTSSKKPKVLDTILYNIDKPLNVHGIKTNNITAIQFDPDVYKENISSMVGAFASDSDLVNITGINNLNTSKVTNMSDAFGDDGKLSNISGISDWNVNNVTSVSDMFISCTALGPNFTNQLMNWRFNKNLNNIEGNDEASTIFSQDPTLNLNWYYSNKNKYTKPKKFTKIIPVSTTTKTAVAPYKLNLKYYRPVAPVESKYDGLTYKYDERHNTVEFTGGTFTPEVNPVVNVNKSNYDMSASDTFASKAPQDIKNASDITFDSDVHLSTPRGYSQLKAMFFHMNNLKSVDMSKIGKNSSQSENIADMQYMFSTDPNLRSVKLPTNLNLKYVSDISFLFGNDPKLANVDLGRGFSQIGNSDKNNLNNSNNVDMDGVFSQTPSLLNEHFPDNPSDNSTLVGFNSDKHTGYTGFDTSHASSMNRMFSDIGIVHLRLPKSFKTSNVKSMDQMFSNNNYLSRYQLGPDTVPITSTPLSSIKFNSDFDTSNVKSMVGMFANDTNFTGGIKGDSDGRLSLPGTKNKHGKIVPGTFNTSNVTNMSGMFANDTKLQELDLPSDFNTENVLNMSNMFENMDAADSAKTNVNGEKGAQYNVVDLTLPTNFIINENCNISNMFGGAYLHSLTLKPNGKTSQNGEKLSNTKFNTSVTSSTTNSDPLSPTNIIPLYQNVPTDQYGYGTVINKTDKGDHSGEVSVKDPSSQKVTNYMPYTLSTPHDFSKGVSGTFMPENSDVQRLAFSDIYSKIDGGDQGLDWRLPKDPKTNPEYPNWKNGAPSGWTYIDSTGFATTDPDSAAKHKDMNTGSDRVLIAPTYHGLILKFNKATNTAEFVGMQSNISPAKEMKNFDRYNASTDSLDPTTGQVTINQAVKNANTIIFDGINPHTSLQGVHISDVPNMSYMFANPNLKKLVFNQPSDYDPILDTSKTSDMEGMFQGAQISDLTLPVGFNTKYAATTLGGIDNMFAGADGKPSTYLKKLTIQSKNSRFGQTSSDTSDKMPTLYKVVNGSNSKGVLTLDNSDHLNSEPANSKHSLVGTYISTENLAPVSDKIELDLVKTNGTKVPLSKAIPLNHYAADSTYTLKDTDIPAGYKLVKNESRIVKLNDTTQSTYHVDVIPEHKYDTVQFKYAPNGKYHQSSDLISMFDGSDTDTNPFAGNDSIDSSNPNVSDTSVTVDNNNPQLPMGWNVVSPTNIPFDGKTHTVYVTPIHVHQTFYYQDKNQSDGTDYNKIVGSSAVSGNSFAASQAGNNQFIVTKSNHSGLAAGYHLMYPSDRQDDNRVEFTGYSDIYIPVELDRNKEDINYQYNNSDVNTSVASFSGTNSQVNVANGMASGYHLASGASSTVSDDNNTHDVSVTPNTITENVSYAVQDNPMYATKNQTFSGFSSAIDDSRTKAKNKSFVVNSKTATSDNYANVPNGFQVSGSYQFGPATTNSANSNSDHTVTITPNHVHLSVDYFNDTSDAQQYIHGSDNHIIASSEYSGLVGNHISIPLNVPKGYSMITPYGQRGSVYDVTNSDELNAMPTKFSPAPSDHVYIYVHPETATSRIQFVDASRDNTNVGGPISVTGQSVNVPGTYNTGFDITSSYAKIPKNYVLVNSDTPVKYDGKTYTVPVVPDNNNIDIVYQYNNLPVHSDLVHRTNPKASVSINGSYAPGLPAGYRLSDEHNVSDDNVFGYQQTSGNVNIVPLIQSDTINYQLNGKTIGVGHVSGNDSRAVTGSDKPVSDTTVTVTNQTDGLPSGYHVVPPKGTSLTFNFDGQPHNVIVAPNNAKDTVQYMYHGVSFGSDQILGNFGSDIDITNANTPDMPSGYHLVNANNNFVANDGTHQVNIAPSTSTFTVNFVNNGKTVGTKQYTGATDTSFTVDGSADTPKGYTINKGQNMNYDFDGDETKDVASLNVTPIPPTMDTESINFIYSDANHQNHNEGSTVHTGVKGSVGTVTPSDYSALKSGWQIIPGENSSNKFFNYTFSDGSVNMFVEPIQQTEKVWFLNDQTGKLIGNDGPFSDTVVVTGNDYRAKDAGDNSFVIGATPNHLNLSYYKVDNPDQVIPFDGYNHGVNVHLVKEAPYSAEASQAAAAKQAAATASINAAKSAIAKKTNQSTANSYASSASKNAASQIPSQAANSIASKNDSSEYSHEQSANSSVASSASSSAVQSQSSKNNSLNSSIAGKTSSESAAKSASSSVAPSSSAESITPFIPIMPSSVPFSVSSVASSVASPSVQSVSSSAAPVTLTNKNYPITYAKSANKPDMVTVMGRKYPVHYHANGKNTVRVRERIMKHGKASYRYKNVVVSTNLPIAHPASDNEVRDVDHIDFRHVNKRAWTAKGLNKVLDSAKPGEVINYHGKRLAVVHDPIHWRYFMVTKSALAHILVTSVGRKNTKDLLNARHTYTIFIKHIVAVHGHKANYVRYEFSFKHRNYWVTGRKDFVPNSYLQKHDFEARHAHYVRVIRPCRLYKSTKYNRLTFIRNVRRGVVAQVAKVVYINRPSYEQTRLVLTNGHYITANKNFVRIVK